MRDLTGQLVLVHNTGLIARTIQAFQSLAHDGAHGMNRWNHVAVMVDNTHTVGAEPGGARLRPVTDFTDTLTSTINYKPGQAHAVAEFMLDRVRRPYAYEDIPLIAVALATGIHTPQWLDNKLSDDGRYICSELADAALTNAGIHLFQNIPPAAVYPSAIATALETRTWLNTHTGQDATTHATEPHASN